mgnify:CR=1 FL=1
MKQLRQRFRRHGIQKRKKRMWRRFAGNGSGGNLFIFSMPEVSVNVTDDEAETTISATRGKMCIRVTRQVKIPHPEKKIRLKKKLETIK